VAKIPDDLAPVVKRLVEQQRSRTSQLSLSESERHQLRELALADTFFMARVVLGYLDLQDDPHLVLCEFLDQQKWIRRLLLAPRGSLKSSLVLAWVIQQAMRDPNTSILYVMSSASLAEKVSRDVDAIFRRNVLLRYLFPECIPNWEEKEQTTWNLQTKIIPRSKASGNPTFYFVGVGTKIVGMHFKIIVLDDFIEFEASQSEEIMRSSVEWARGCEPILIKPTQDQILVVGTLWGKNDYYEQLSGYKQLRTNKKLFKAQGDPRYVVMRRRAAEDGVAFWPQRFSLKDLAELKIGLEATGKGGMFYRWYMNDPTDEANCAFPRTMIRYYDWNDKMDRCILRIPDAPPIVVPLSSLRLTMTVDPASTTKKKSDKSAISVVGSHPKGYRINLYAWRGKVTPDVLIDKIFGIVVAYRQQGKEIAKVAIEQVGAQENLLHWIGQQIATRKTYINIEWRLKTSRSGKRLHGGESGKDDRILGFIPVVASGSWYTNKQFVDENMEMETYPNGSHVDWLDALAYQPQIWGMSEAPPEVINGVEIYEDEEEEIALQERPVGYGG
jgi:hypothetical protein